ncbi:MAG: thioesterase family protein [Clostridia bacterium]
MMELISEVVVRYAETDQMGIAHHSHYAVWFEAARTEFIKSLGMSYTQCEERGIRLPLFSISTSFIRPAHYEDVLLVRAYILEMTPARLVMGYQVSNKESGVLLSEGTTRHAWTDRELKPVNLKKYDKEIYDMLCNACESSL